MWKNRSKQGFSLAELLIVVAIIVVLAGVAFVSVSNYFRSLTKREYDEYARSIFVAAQNHLMMAKHEGYLGRTGYGEPESAIAGLTDTGDGVFYFVVENGSGLNNSDSVLSLILPEHSVDDTVLAESYIIRYHKESGQVLDVFFWSETGRRFFSSNGLYGHTYESSDYEQFLRNRGNRDALRTYGADRSVIGYYGGVQAQGGQSNPLDPPMIDVENAERLKVKVMNPVTNSSSELILVVHGLTSGERKVFSTTNGLVSGGRDPSNTYDIYNIVLDDITASGKHFSQQFPAFIPGENLRIYAIAYNSAESVTSTEKRTNSLFASINDIAVPDTATITCIRHLENLDAVVSGLGTRNTDKVKITRAIQDKDLSWTAFQNEVGPNAPVVGINTTLTKQGCFYPISPAVPGGGGLTGVVSYDGQSKSIFDVKVDIAGDAGLFGLLYGSVSNLKLVDFCVSATGTSGSAGALAGTMQSTASVNNVLAINKGGLAYGDPRKISSSGNAGGLIGNMSGGTVQNSAAALIVSGTTNAGGLIGVSTGGSVTGCYSGGHTKDGSYEKWINSGSPVHGFDITGDTAGGLIGKSGIAIRNCYSTCSVSGGSIAGGFIGNASGSIITKCYCTGLVSGGLAFTGNRPSSMSGCYYFGIINDTMLPYPEYDVLREQGRIVSIDHEISTYRSFVPVESAWTTVDPYDEKTTEMTLKAYYNYKYNLQTVKQLGQGAITDGNIDFTATHYGDWPAPEIFFVNTPAA